MKKTIQLSAMCLVIFIVSSHAQQSISNVELLTGTWKMEGKETYEHWEKDGETLKGHSYKIIEGKKRVMETLSIKKHNGKVVYEALVPNQNNGQAIPFVMNEDAKDQLSFENLSHDFPKKIQYKQVGENKLFVQVLGENDQGFSYYLFKQQD